MKSEKLSTWSSLTDVWQFLKNQILQTPDATLILHKSAAMSFPMIVLDLPTMSLAVNIPPFKLIKQEKQINSDMCSPCLFWSYECWENVIRCVGVVTYGRNITYGKVKCQQLPKYQQPRMRLHRPDVRCINMSSLIYFFNLQD